MAFRTLYDQNTIGVQTPPQRFPEAPPSPQPSPGIPPRYNNLQEQPVRPTQPTSSKPPTITPFFNTIFQSMQNIDPETRTTYLQNTMNSIKMRLDNYELRLARGIPLTPEQQQQYTNLQNSFNDIQRYLNNPTAYDKQFGATTTQVLPSMPALNIRIRQPGQTGMF